MLLTPDQFIASPRRAITLLGMSGVGKTTLADVLPKANWFHYSGDYRIGTKYLAEPILDNIKRQVMAVPFLRDLLRADSIYIASNITVGKLLPISTFLGKLGSTELGGLGLEEFKRTRVTRMSHVRNDILGMSWTELENKQGGKLRFTDGDLKPRK